MDDTKILENAIWQVLNLSNDEGEKKLLHEILACCWQQHRLTAALEQNKLSANSLAGQLTEERRRELASALDPLFAKLVDHENFNNPVFLIIKKMYDCMIPWLANYDPELPPPSACRGCSGDCSKQGCNND